MSARRTRRRIGGVRVDRLVDPALYWRDGAAAVRAAIGYVVARSSALSLDDDGDRRVLEKLLCHVLGVDT